MRRDFLVERTIRQFMQVKRRIEIGDAISADGLDEFVVWKRMAVFSIHILPRADFGGFRIEDEAIEVEDQCGNHVPHYTRLSFNKISRKVAGDFIFRR